ncbi:hypothetical protein DFH28DRAFT_921229 [Melampsora americana]|nr:hypothetical protein DFH28DRAFT_921229 [Melampsora americana]
MPGNHTTQHTLLVPKGAQPVTSHWYQTNYCEDLIAHNKHFEYHNSSSYSSSPAPMDPQLLLASFLPMTLTPPANTPVASSNEELQCRGHNGQFAPLHSTRMNRGCTIKACFECCNKLNNLSGGCGPHQQQEVKKRKAKETTMVSQLTTTTTTELSTSSGVEISGAPTKFRSISIKKQAEERVQNNEIALAKKLVTLVVWSGGKDDPFGYKSWRVQANKWPLFSLDQSEELLELIENKLGSNWKGGLRVWNHEELNWVHIKLNTIELYPKDCKKILVIFPNIKATLCEDVDHHLASVAPMSQKAAMDIRALILPSMTPSNTSLNTSSITPHKSQILSSGYSTPVHIPDSDDESITFCGLNNDTVPDEPGPALYKSLPGNSSSSGGRQNGNNWPRGVTMRAMLKFLERSLVKKVSIKAAWEEQFKHTHTFASTTVSTYWTWLLKIKMPQLTEYVAKHGDHTVEQGKDYFDKLWEQCDTRPKKRARQSD